MNLKRSFELLLGLLLPDPSEGMEIIAPSFVGMQVFKVASEEIEGASLIPCAKGPAVEVLICQYRCGCWLHMILIDQHAMH
jgi:hypothetical protein